MTKSLPGLVALALLGVLAFQWIGWPPPATAPEAVDGSAPSPDASTALPSQSDLLAKLDSEDAKENYVAITERPLFRPDRKPEPPPDEEPAAAPGDGENADLNAMDLSAVMITPASVSAWVRDPAQPKLRRLRIGDDFQGWSVREILEDRVLLERQGKQDALILRDYAKMPAAASPASNPRRPPPRAPTRAAPPKK